MSHTKLPLGIRLNIDTARDSIPRWLISFVGSIYSFFRIADSAPDLAVGLVDGHYPLRCADGESCSPVTLCG